MTTVYLQILYNDAPEQGDHWLVLSPAQKNWVDDKRRHGQHQTQPSYTFFLQKI